MGKKKAGVMNVIIKGTTVTRQTRGRQTTSLQKTMETDNRLRWVVMQASMEMS